MALNCISLGRVDRLPDALRPEGLPRWATPKGRSASTTALTIVAAPTIVPNSPASFAHSGLFGKIVSVRLVSNIGSDFAEGTAYSSNNPATSWPWSS